MEKYPQRARVQIKFTPGLIPPAFFLKGTAMKQDGIQVMKVINHAIETKKPVQIITGNSRESFIWPYEDRLMTIAALRVLNDARCHGQYWAFIQTSDGYRG